MGAKFKGFFMANKGCSFNFKNCFNIFCTTLSSPPLSHSLVGSDTFLFNKSQYFIQKENNIKNVTFFCLFFFKKKNLKKKNSKKRTQNRIAWNPGLKNLAWAETVREIKDYSTDRMLKTFPYYIFIHPTRSNHASMYLAKKKHENIYHSTPSDFK